MLHAHRLYRLPDRQRVAVTVALRHALAGEPDIVFAYLFGSFAEGEAFHDIDIALHLCDLSPPDASRRAFEIAGRLEGIVAYPLDVVALNGRPATFRYHACRGSLLDVRDEERLADELTRTASEYFDIEPVLRHAAREAFR